MKIELSYELTVFIRNTLVDRIGARKNYLRHLLRQDPQMNEEFKKQKELLNREQTDLKKVDSAINLYRYLVKKDVKKVKQCKGRGFNCSKCIKKETCLQYLMV